MKRFQFSLRTLLIVVTLLAVPCWYVGTQYRIVQARNRYFVEHPSAKEENLAFGGMSFLLRQILGDAFHLAIYVDSDSDEEMERVQALFPEAFLYHLSDLETISPTPIPWRPPKNNSHPTH